MTRKTIYLFLFSMFCYLFVGRQEASGISVKGLLIVQDGESCYSVVIPGNAIPAETSAAEELVFHIEKISGAKLPIVKDNKFTSTHAILLGNCKQLEKSGVVIDEQILGKEEYILKTTGIFLVIAGGRPRGTLYGVYELLEKHLGCRWFAPDTSYIPSRKTIFLPKLDITGKPAFEFRDPWMYAGDVYSWWWRDHFSAEYVARTRNSGNMIHLHCHPIDDQYGNRFKIPYYGHNLSLLVPAAAYAGSHPEYFALWKGERLTSGDLELCLSNNKVAEIAAETMIRWMQEHPDADLFHIGQSDTFRWCECETCQAAYQHYLNERTPVGFGSMPAQRGGYTGVYFNFVNEVAKRVEKKFPETKIGTYAYGTTMPPRKNIILHKNIVVWFCPLQRCSCHAINQGPTNNTYWRFISELLPAWLEIGSKVYAYEYWLRGLSRYPDIDGHGIIRYQRYVYSTVWPGSSRCQKKIRPGRYRYYGSQDQKRQINRY